MTVITLYYCDSEIDTWLWVVIPTEAFMDNRSLVQSNIGKGLELDKGKEGIQLEYTQA